MINRRLLRLFFRYFHTQKRKLCRQMTCAWTCQLWAVQSNCFSVTGWAETRSGSIIARYNTLVPLPPSAPGPPCRPVLPSTSLPTPHPCVLSLSDVTRALVTVAVVLCGAAWFGLVHVCSSLGGVLLFRLFVKWLSGSSGRLSEHGRKKNKNERERG